MGTGRRLLVLALALGCAACGSAAPPPAPSPPPPQPPSSTVVQPAWRPDAGQDEAACDRSKTVPWAVGNEPYAGPGPHFSYPIEVQLDPREPEDAVDSKNFSDIADDMVLPRDREPQGWQLIACVYDGQPTRRAGTLTCHFDSTDTGEPGEKTFPFEESRYEVVVREARTGNVVTTLDVPGTASDADSCPRLLTYRSDTVLLRGLDGQAFGEALRPVFTSVR